jgi:hypothetical protein
LEDAVELFNPTASAVDIGGWYLSDDSTHLKKYQIPANTALPAGGFKVFYEYEFNTGANPALDFSFSSAHGDDLYLAEADVVGNLTGYRTHVDFGAAANGVSFGRFATSEGIDFTALSALTFGASNPATVIEFRAGTGLSNAYPKIGPVVISEIMYHPPDLGTNDNTRDEFVELHNLTATAVPLFDLLHPTNAWRLRGTCDFDFPTNLLLPSQAYLVLVSFDPATNTTALAAFQAKYGTNASLLGPYTGKLNNGSGSVELYRPDPPQALPGPEFGFVPYILVDRVKYSDRAPWPSADGSGPSLQRMDVAAYGNDPTNWFASSFTPGASHLPPLNEDSDNDGMPDDWETTHHLVVGVNDAALDPDGDGMSNLREYLSGTDPQLSTSVLRLDAMQRNGDVLLGFTAQAGRTYTVQFTTNLLGGNWEPCNEFLAVPTNQVIQITNTAVIEQGARWYRLVTPAVP